MAQRPMASLSLDLDNQWSYLKTHGDARWESHPSYLDRVVPIALELLQRVGLDVTFFVVGYDAEQAAHESVLRAIASEGHEIGNHSYSHEPWLHLYDDEQIATELDRTSDAIAAAVGTRPVAFRGPGYSLSEPLIRSLQERGYRVDASTLPTWIGPLARRYYFRSTDLDADERERRSQLFGSWRDGLRPVAPYRWSMPAGSILELPVTTMPVLRVPMHLSYVLYLEQVSPAVARAYFRTALLVCRATKVEPSILLHPLDFLGGDDLPDSGLEFFPGMNVPGERKRRLVESCLRMLKERFDVVPITAHADAISRRDLADRPIALAGPGGS
jgi:peptidoglycan/xylan/chitin deacetylase (PgdA/CDA1 family)